MEKITTYILLCAMFIFSGLATMAQTAKKPEQLTKESFLKKVWNYEESPNEFKYLGDKPCLIDFHADWCGWCKRIAPIIEELCTAYYGQIYVYKIDTDKQKELQALFKVKSLPTLMFIPMNAAPTTILGAQSKEKFEQLINYLLLNK